MRLIEKYLFYRLHCQVSEIQGGDNQKRHHDAHAKLRAFHVDDNVHVKDFLNTKKWLPGRIIQVRGPISYHVKLRDG